ncbi:hypothetical protein BLNAU_2480 [Blattamonas nauphoetae]|uniref:FYVE-type domain-containing protein n=1 Tax=Blattamonas nauphoetae TaxID=2049346 RepID=A0ABQ9YFW1_9EUKA|nr:hypothetical protein BLNAU_2480 [Blattamonas nauphoetae]
MESEYDILSSVGNQIKLESNVISLYTQHKYHLIPTEKMSGKQARSTWFSTNNKQLETKTTQIDPPFTEDYRFVPSVRIGWNFVLFVGGMNSPKTDPGLWLYCTETEQFSEVPLYCPLHLKSKPFLPFYGHALCTLRYGQLGLCFGGVVDQVSNLPINRTLCFDCLTFEWGIPELFSPSPPARTEHSLTAWRNTRAILYGGIGESGDVMNDIHIFNSDLGTWTQIQSQGTLYGFFRRSHSSIVVRNCLFVYGGVDERQTIQNSLLRFDLESLSWTQLHFHTDLADPPPVTFHSALCLVGVKHQEEPDDPQNSLTPQTIGISLQESKKLRVLVAGGEGYESMNQQIFTLSLPIPQSTITKGGMPPDLNSTSHTLYMPGSADGPFSDPEVITYQEVKGTETKLDELGYFAEEIELFSEITIARQTATEKQAPKWVPDEASQSCRLCKSRFTVVNRRHHCRYCGYVFCGKCCYKKADIPEYNIFSERVCNNCFDILKAKYSQ